MSLLIGARRALLRSPASAGAGNDSYTSLLLHCDGSDASTTFTDSSSNAHTVTANGDAQIDTAQSKFGGASGLFDGTGDYLSIPTHASLNFGTGDFTIDWQVRFASVTPDVDYMHSDVTGTGPGFDNYLDGTFGNQWRYKFANATNWSPSANTWYHLAIARSGTTVKIFIDGTQSGSSITDSTDYSATGDWNIGRRTNGTLLLNGWIDEFRISKGIARWTANFTPPTEAYS